MFLSGKKTLNFRASFVTINLREKQKFRAYVYIQCSCTLNTSLGCAWLSTVHVQHVEHEKRPTISKLEVLAYLCHRQSCRTIFFCFSRRFSRDMRMVLRNLVAHQRRSTQQQTEYGNDSNDIWTATLRHSSTSQRLMINRFICTVLDMDTVDAC